MQKGWPVVIRTTLGNGQDLVRQGIARDDEGDVLYVRYTQPHGYLTLKVFND
jgi:hypothetical protein